MSKSANDVKPFRTVLFADSVLAQPAFQALVQGGWIAGLCTASSKKTNANLRQTAKLANIPLFEADKASLTLELREWIKNLRPDLLISFTFPYLLPLEILHVPSLGSFNLHTGKLPEYRGPQPVFWQILNRETEGALTLHRMEEKFDSGALVASHSVSIAPEDTYGLHSVRLAFAGIKLVEFLIGGLIQYGTDLPVLPQDERRASFQNRPTVEDLIVRWEEQPGEQIRALVKACNPWNYGAYTSIRGINLCLSDVTLIAGGGNSAQPPGAILLADLTKGVTVNCREGSALQLDVIFMDEGILPARALAGFGIRTGERFETLAPSKQL